jgi:Flp pilus assembly protein TadD
MIPVGALFLLALLANWNLGVDDGRGGERTREAVWMVEQGSYEQARRYVAKISSDHAHPGVLRFHVGEAFMAAGRYDDAIVVLREALEIDGDRAAIHLVLGQALLAAGRADEAVAHLAYAANAGFRPEVSGPWLVRALATLGRGEQVVTLIAALPEEVAASRPQVALDLGATALEFGAPGPAERWLRLAVALGPSDADAHEKLGVARLLLKRPGEALSPLETACRLDPSSASARLNLAVVYAQFGRVDEARAQAEEAVRLDPKEPRAVGLLRELATRARR